ncbi:HTH-type transcriptional regulator HdfR [Paraburkholderia solisilvae]|uniref:HTH-type transcriptional regulator HdfR n=2 Tax=Paraburkholderia solisilvae TaxID=624376 RepID=A0A6J5D2H7_9BURK|nr:HTH-type transcriptional regulator HdfR [Paraburkholderia solisilvae]
MVAELGSMTAAANRLHLTQGAVSQQIRRLEETLDCPLIRREGRRLELTPAGERLLAKARHLLKMNDEIWADMSARPLSGTLRLGLPYDLVGTCFPAIFQAFGEAYPYVDIALRCATSPELSAAIADGALEIAVIEEPADEASGEVLRLDQLVWVGARGGLSHRKRPLPVSMVAETCAFRSRILELLGESQIGWRTVFESGNIEATRVTVRGDLAVTAWLASTVPADMDILSAESGLPTLPTFAITLQMTSGAGPVAQEFARYVRDAMPRWRATDG